MGGLSEDLSSPPLHLDSDNDQRVYFVPYSWWKDADNSLSGDADAKRGLPFLASPGSSYAGPMKIINSIFNSDLVFNLRSEDDSSQNSENGEVGVSGRDYALVSGEMWVQALKWHIDSKSSTRNGSSFSAAEDNIADVYPLQLRLSIQREANLLGVRISKKDNVVELFRRACKIFNVESELLRIWDFSGQTISFFSDNTKQRQSDQEVLLELQVYGLSDFIKCKEGKKDELAYSILGNSSGMMNGASGSGSTGCFRVNSSVFSGSSREAGSLGLTGLQNLGNTCFMNSALQCLVHTPKLVDYFLGDYGREINHDNPLGMNGEIALTFGDMLRKLWAPGASPVAPRTFKSKLARFAPQFSGFNQHDSQELLAFLLDGLHEDLNRVKNKPYVEAKDGDGRPDNDVADEYWQNHLARNDSIIVDVCQGQYKSTLVCPICKKVSTTFDPFMYLSLPLPSTTMRTMTLTVVSTDGSTPAPYTITVPKSGKWEDLIKALSIASSLKEDETLLVAEVYNNRIIRYLEEPADSLSLIRDGDRLVAYRLAKDDEQVLLAVFMHQKIEEQYINGKHTTSPKAFGFPLVAKLPTAFNGSDIQDIYKKLFSPFQVSAQDAVEENLSSDVDAIVPREEENGTNSPSACVIDHLRSEDGVSSLSDADLQFYTTDEKGAIQGSEIQVGESVVGSEKSKRLHVLVCWPEKQIERCDTRLLTSLPEVFKSSFSTKRPQESVSLYKCLEAFLQEEPLGPEDMWFCPGCKKHCQASKKLDLWRLPEILVIHLKRFSYSRFTKNKLETYVDFPIDDLDLSMYVAYKNGQSCSRYVLYAVSNHYGNMGGGHYTAYVHMLVRQYEKAIASWHEKELKADYDTTNTMPVLKTPSPMEKQAADLYSRRIFRKFQEELVETLANPATKIDDTGTVATYRVAKFGEDHKAHAVSFNSIEMKTNCSCQLFEYSGIICRHILAVFKAKNVLTLPSQYVLKRWTRNARNGAAVDEHNSELPNESEDSLTVRYNNLRQEAIKYVEEGAKSIQVYNVSMDALKEASRKVAAVKNHGPGVANGDIMANGVVEAMVGTEENQTVTYQSVEQKEKKICELSAELEKTNQRCEVYRSNLLAVLRDMEEQKLKLSVKVQNARLSLKE